MPQTSWNKSVLPLKGDESIYCRGLAQSLSLFLVGWIEYTVSRFHYQCKSIWYFLASCCQTVTVDSWPWLKVFYASGLMEGLFYVWSALCQLSNIEQNIRTSSCMCQTLAVNPIFFLSGGWLPVGTAWATLRLTSTWHNKPQALRACGVWRANL